MSAALIAQHVLTGHNFAIHPGNGSLGLLPTNLPATPGLYLSPGWVDLQVNGFAGHDINSPILTVEDVSALNARLWQEGVTAWCPTVITAPAGQIEHSLRIIDQVCRQNAQVNSGVAGIHLEGPYISAAEGTHGAHPPQHIHPPDWAEFEGWQSAAGGRIRIVTLAPEQPGSMEFIRRLVEAGVIPALGHTRASTALIQEAVAAGARLSTHLGNGIQTTLLRHPNPIWDQLAEDELSASLIFDGFHLPANVMKVFLRTKGIKRCLLVSDASALARLIRVYTRPRWVERFNSIQMGASRFMALNTWRAPLHRSKTVLKMPCASRAAASNKLSA